MAPRGGPRRRWHELDGPRGSPPLARGTRSRTSTQLGPLPPTDHDARRASRRWPPGWTPWPTCWRPMSRSRWTIGPAIRAADPGPANLPRLLCVRAARRHDVEASRHGDPRGVVPAADLLLQQHLGDPRSGRSGLGAARVERARLRARGRRARRHPGAGSRSGARRGGNRRLPDPQRLERAGPPARGDDRSPRARPRGRTSRPRSARGW